MADERKGASYRITERHAAALLQPQSTQGHKVNRTTAPRGGTHWWAGQWAWDPYTAQDQTDDNGSV